MSERYELTRKCSVCGQLEYQNDFGYWLHYTEDGICKGVTTVEQVMERFDERMEVVNQQIADMAPEISPVNWYDHMPQTHPIGETFEDGFRKGFLKAQEIFTNFKPDPNRSAWNQTQDARDGKMYPPDAEKAMKNIEDAIFDKPWKFKPDWSAEEWQRLLRNSIKERDEQIARLTAMLRECQKFLAWTGNDERNQNSDIAAALAHQSQMAIEGTLGVREPDAKKLQALILHSRDLAEGVTRCSPEEAKRNYNYLERDAQDVLRALDDIEVEFKRPSTTDTLGGLGTQ